MDSQRHTKWEGVARVSSQDVSLRNKPLDVRNSKAGLGRASVYAIAVEADTSCRCFLACQSQGKAWRSWVLCWRTEQLFPADRNFSHKHCFPSEFK